MASGGSPLGNAPRIAVIGGGQLARMMAEPANALGISLRLLAEVEGASAAQVIPDHRVGDHRDLATLRAVADGCAVVTFDHEHVPTEHLRALEAAGIACRPGSAALVHAQDKAEMRAAMERLGAPQPRWAVVGSADEVEAFGLPCVLKMTRGGYDGRGVWVVAHPRRRRRAAGHRGAHGRAAARRGAGRLPTGAGGARRPGPERRGRDVPGRGDDASSTASATR